MKTAYLVTVTMAAALTARADFSYKSTQKAPEGGMMAAAAAAGGPQTSKHYLKGQKLKVETGDNAIVIDFDAQTVTTISNATKTYTVKKFSDLTAPFADSDVDAKIDVKQTGQRKTINGFNASEIVMTIEVDNPQTRQAGMKMQMEISTWVSSDVPGAQELRTFYQKNGDRFPWAALSGGGGGTNASMQKAFIDIRRKMAGMSGVPVLQVMRTKMGGGGGPSDAQMAQAQDGMAQARAQMEAMVKQGGPQAEMAKQALARMGGVPGGGGGASLFVVTTDFTDFSAAAIPDSVFQVPAGFQQK